jgi:O-methyltransferase
MAFYGVVDDDDDMREIREHALAIIAIYEKHGLPALNADNMLLAMRSTLFMENAPFNEAIQKFCRNDDGEVQLDDIVKFWRLHVYTWCCDQALRLPGSLVECGVHMGLYSRTMMQALDFAARDREMVLYDTFEGLSSELSTAHEMSVVGAAYDIADWEQQVRDSFRPWPNARIVCGRVPDVLADTAPESVSFLHLDMNAARPEVAAFEFFEDRLVPGAMVLLDDYGRHENTEIGRAHKQLFEGRLGRPILELPTGQGLVILN